MMTPTDHASSRQTIAVTLGDRSYDVLIGTGLLSDAGRLIAERLSGRTVVVTDANVARHHLAALQEGLTAAGRWLGAITVPPGEATKSYSALASLCDDLLATGLERGDLVVALGGGVIGDLAGFAASIVRRGVRFVQIPTTLLAQVDSSVGGKTGINSRLGKNLVGTFHQPGLVIADIGVLDTLAPREMRAGYAEVAKYGLLGDADFFRWLENSYPAVLANDRAALGRAVATSIAAKAAIVARDETETGDRALLNLGHTFGHALEAFAGYSGRLLHGEAIAIGMCLAFELSEDLGLCPEGCSARVRRHLADAGLPTRISDINGEKPDAPTTVRLMAQDKKVKGGQLTLILARDIGSAFTTRDIQAAKIEAFLQDRITSAA
jgi:3-dehydroquinate synthase